MELRIREKLTDVLRDVFNSDIIVATSDLNSSMVSGWDSLTNVRLMMEVERAFSVRFNAAEISSLQNIGELAELIRTKLERAR